MGGELTSNSQRLVAQLVERIPYKGVVVGSNPTESIILLERSKHMKKQIRDLLIRLQDSNKPAEQRKLRKRLRRLGHKGASRGKKIRVKKLEVLSVKKRKRIKEHNKEVTRRIKSGEYKPFS